jgi:hypothetical protein
MITTNLILGTSWELVYESFEELAAKEYSDRSLGEKCGVSEFRKNRVESIPTMLGDDEFWDT